MRSSRSSRNASGSLSSSVLMRLLGSPAMLEQARKRITGLGLTNTVTLLEADGAQLPFGDDSFDVVLVPGVMHSSPVELAARLGGMQPEIEWLRAMHLRGVRIAASCSGTFLLAATGLLDGHRATTSWWLAAAMRQAFPGRRRGCDPGRLPASCRSGPMSGCRRHSC